jgi:hypothetical protein
MDPCRTALHPLFHTANRDPLRIGQTGRWLDATGAVPPNNGERQA